MKEISVCVFEEKKGITRSVLEWFQNAFETDVQVENFRTQLYGSFCPRDFQIWEAFV